MAVVAAGDAVVERLAPICVAQYTQDPEKDQKLKTMMEKNAWERGAYIAKQGWATMPGEKILTARPRVSVRNCLRPSVSRDAVTRASADLIATGIPPRARQMGIDVGRTGRTGEPRATMA